MLASVAEIALAIQTAKGSAAAASTFRFPVMAGLPEDVRPTNTANEQRSTRMGGEPWSMTPYAAGGSTIAMRPRAIGALLYGVLGAKAVSGASDPWTHTLTLGSALPYLTVWRSFAGGLNERFVDARLSKLAIESRAGEVVKATFELLSGSPRYRTAQETTATLETTQHFEHVHGAAALLLENVAYRSIDEWSLSIDSGLAIEETLAGPQAKLNGPAQILVTARVRPADAALWRRAVYGSASPANDAAAVSTPLELAGSPAGVRFTLTAATGPERSLRIDVPRVVLEPMPMQPDAQGGAVRNTLQMRAYPTTTPITATLKNGVSAY